MASALQLSGVKGNLAVTSRRGLHCQPLLSRRIGFAAFVAPVPRLCCARRVSSEKVAFSVNCKAAKGDVLEKDVTEEGRFGETETSFTCVMKFGGSSVASAERMREVAGLILSFPEERPIIVLSAMGKTTNKLLLVFFFSFFFFFFKTRSYVGFHSFVFFLRTILY